MNTMNASPSLSSMANSKKKDLTKCVEELSIHGWPKLFAATTWQRKLTWLICCGIAFSCFIYFTTEVLTSYFKLDTYTSIRVTQEKSLPLPAATFCNTNYMSAFDPAAQAVVNQELPRSCSNFTESDFVNVKNQQYFEIGCRMFIANSKEVISTAKSDNFSFPAQFHLLPHSWPCFTLNRNQNLRQSNVNEREGIRMILFFNESEQNVGRLTDPNFIIKDERRGIFLDIHDPAKHYHKSEGIYLMTGFHTLVKIKKKISVKLGSPFSPDCHKDKKESHSSAGKYSVERCRFNCFATAVYKKCGVMPANIRQKLYGSKPLLRNITKDRLRCYQNAVYAYDTSDCNCPPPCRKVSFEKEISYNKWPQNWQLRYLAPIVSEVTNISQHNINIELVRKHLIFLSIYFGELTETEEMEVEAYGPAKALSDFGGQMGIFLGASFISLFEIVLLILTSACKRFKH